MTTAGERSEHFANKTNIFEDLVVVATAKTSMNIHKGQKYNFKLMLLLHVCSMCKSVKNIFVFQTQKGMIYVCLFVAC